MRANTPIGHSRWNAIRPGLSDGRLVAVRAEASALDIASPARVERPSAEPMMPAISHHAAATMTVV